MEQITNKYIEKGELLITIFIYAIQNQINLKLYVGETKNPKKRWNRHKRKDSNCVALRGAINKYGKDNFIFTIIEEIKIDTHNKTDLEIENIIDEAEQFWIAFFQSNKKEFGYNLTNGGKRTIFNDETLKKLSIAGLGRKHTEETKKNISNMFKGRKLTQEWKDKISKSKIGKPGPKHSEETKAKTRGENGSLAKLTNAQAKEIRELFYTGNFTSKKLASIFGVKSCAILCIIKNKTFVDPNYIFDEHIKNILLQNQLNPNMENIKKKIIDSDGIIYNSIREAAAILKVKPPHISRVLNGTRNKVHGKKFYYLKDKLNELKKD